MIIEDILAGYVTCALWSETDEYGFQLENHYTKDDIDPESMASMRETCAAFYAANEEDCDSADYTSPPDADYNDNERVGHDLWLTRNGHGTGFWDRDLGAVGDRLTSAAEAIGEAHLYVGDDGRLHYFQG